MWTAAIIAGGQAQRLGGCDKGALLVGDQTILAHQIAVLREVVDEILIVTNRRSRARFRDVAVPIAIDLLPDRGPLGGIYTALSVAAGERSLIVAADMPFLSVQFLRHMVALGETADIVVPRTNDGYQPLCATYARVCAAQMRERLTAGALKAVDFLREAEGLTIRELGSDDIGPFDSDGTLFFNVNTPDDYARAIQHARHRPAPLLTGHDA